MIRITKNRYLAGFSAIVILLALIRLVSPSVAIGESKSDGMAGDSLINKDDKGSMPVAVIEPQAVSEETSDEAGASKTQAVESVFRQPSFYDSKGNVVKHRINSVPGFSKTFPDNNDVQLIAAGKHGVKPVEDRADAEKRKKELVYVGACPYFYVDRLHNSIPYLVPRAANLLNDIGRAYYDSLQIKGIPLHQIIVTSVLRSRDDIRRLRGHNGNATENSCHLYGTTFDVCYNRYKTVSDPDGAQRRAVRNDTLKWVLSEVLRDMRESGRCYVKYEVKQGCFHITVR
ncbi:MAG: DUF5715 family protein [Prevotella sp.]